ncbi:hypothetical protein [Caballeronia novacaledonica]|uniref:Uncharacterized protein n=1 Tax=Caballeronia novacaledonica TaxID=1544861 RepID=A0AA37MIZ5_9BURK|nr:hypothetical protein [Caballeronia novacaledonica]GJH29295.1 hypothetical protein CBA19CS42_32285 [Caballeronia novacaledonica]
MPEYLICNVDESLPRSEYKFRVTAESPEAAIALFNQRVMSKDKLFREHVLSESVNAGILEDFYLKSDFEQDLFNQTGTVLASEDVARVRIRRFFGERTDFAEAFLAYFDDHDPSHITDQIFEFLSHGYGHGFVAVDLSTLPVLA